MDRLQTRERPILSRGAHLARKFDPTNEPFDNMLSSGYPVVINWDRRIAWILLFSFWLLASTQFCLHAFSAPDSTVGDTGITPEQIMDAFPPRDPYNSSNWFGTSLYGYDECANISQNTKGWINEAYADANKLVNLQGVKSGIDWNSISALEYLGPPALNMDQWKQIQAVFKNTATVRCDDPAQVCSYKCPTTRDETEDGQVIAYARNPDTAAGRKWPDISLCPAWYGMRNLDDAIAYGTGLSNLDQSQDISNYVSRASAFLHQLFHLDLAADSVNGNPNPQVRDLKIRYKSKTGWYLYLPMITGENRDEPAPRSTEPFVIYGDNGDDPAILIDFSPETVGNTSHISGSGDCPTENVDGNDPYSFEVGKAIPIGYIWTCGDVASNLYADVSIKDPEGNSIYDTPRSASSPGQPIDGQHPLEVTADGMQETLTIVGEHTNDYIQFYYGKNLSWTLGDTEGNAKCSLWGDDWGDGPSGCPNAAAAARNFACQYPC
ncbi:hypothetical protein F4680DRAFT_448280 [Xylaria scruposa]|nr:hypothetical protein F4680DRAFT_448280 [Xylaria scruposa]